MRLHRAWLVLAITFLALLVSAGLRSAPSVMIRPLELSMGWDRATISFAVAIGILFYGLTGPFSAALTQRVGMRAMMIGGLVLMCAGTLSSLWMTAPWQFLLGWGIVSGVGTGAVAPVLASQVINRWFVAHRGLAMGLLSASTATGALLFLPLFAWLTGPLNWRAVAMVVGIGALLILPVIWFLMSESPQSLGLTRLGESAEAVGTRPRVAEKGVAGGLGAFTALGSALNEPMFWLLAGTFFVCGLTTNGLVGTHMIAYCGDIGIGSVAAAGMLSTMGIFDIFGTTASGWLTDRVDPRKLLFVYYGLRGLSLIALPYAGDNPASLSIFVIFYGLDWVATVPPTVALVNRSFGEQAAPIIFGWIMVAHQLGAATAAFGAGAIRESTGSYGYAFMLAGAFGLLAALATCAMVRDRQAVVAAS